MACVLSLGLATTDARAAYLDLMGIPELQAMLGPNMPDGTGIKVQQVEAEENGGYSPIPDPANASLYSGKTITMQSGATSFSSHANNVADNFYSNGFSLTPGITEVDVYSAGNWMAGGFLRSNTGSAPNTTDARVANHSWITSDFGVTNELQRLDYIVEEDDFIQVVGMANTGAGTFNSPIWGTAFNGISVGLNNGNHYSDTVVLASPYNNVRVAPTLVTPGFSSDDGATVTSYAAPMVSAATVLLLETGQDALLSNGSYTNRTRTINHAESSEVIKAVLMAGAVRDLRGPRNNTGSDDLTDYTVDTVNNLDSRYGAGQMNVYNSYMILAEGETDSVEDGGPATVGTRGWDYDAAFGGSSGSNTTATYSFKTIPIVNSKVIASLVWNLDIEDGNPGPNFSPSAQPLRNLNLALKQGAATIDTSNSTIDNTENLFVDVNANETFDLVVSKTGGNFLHDYAIAWRTELANEWVSDGQFSVSWSTSSNWSNYVANGTNNGAAFHDALNGDLTVLVNQNVTLRGIWFDSPHAYTLDSIIGSEITLDDGASSDVMLLVTDENGTANHDVFAPIVLVDDLTVDQQTTGLFSTSDGINNSAGRSIVKTGSGDWRIDGTQTHGAGASLDVQEGRVVFDSDAGIGGANLAVTVSGGEVKFAVDQALASLTVNAGSIDIGSSPGQITTNTYSQADGVTLDIELNGTTGGSQFDQIVVTGAASIDGDLNLQLGFSPNFGNQFTIIAADALTGTFDTISGVLHDNLTMGLAVMYTADDVIVTSTYAGDATLDLQVNELDLAQVAANWNQTGQTWSGGDFTGDGVVDDFDLYVISRNWQSAVPLNEAIEEAFAAVIPEPASGLIGLIGLAAITRRRRRAA